MSVTIQELLGDLRAAALDERDKGDKFERLVQGYLRNDPEWSARFTEVWLWSEWPGRRGRPDTGIDLVAANRDRDDFTAIQCKFYEGGRTVSKGDIDSFIAASSKAEFSARYIFDTARAWSPNAFGTLEGLTIPVQRIDITYLDDAAFDWSQYSWTTPEVLVPTGKKTLRPHQARALEDVFKGLRTHDRGKLIMACGTGKTYTSLKIAEEIVGAGGTVLFLVPSIQLLSQSLREWMAEADADIRPFAVCSDVRVGRRVNSDDADMSVVDLTEPATTDAATLIARMNVGRHAKERMTVVFSTYQSIDVIAQTQKQDDSEFDLIICDEAHRTTGVTLAGGDESAFVKVHDNGYLRAAKRLYMTATPRVFGEEVRRKAADAEAILADMGDESTFGPELHRLGFGDAVEADLLTDYKVLVLAVDEEYVAENFQSAMATGGEIALGDAAKLIGCWNGLAKHYGSADRDADGRVPMRKAVAFAKDIKSSKTAAMSFPALVDRALQDEATDRAHRNRLHVEATHVDGTMGIHERNTHLAWLKQDTPDDVCRILTNARCLSEGVDVPALDAVLFLTPRGSQVDVVQSVGRVMRKAPGKQLGYIILPIVVPSGVAAEEALKDNERYRVVWQVLQALRSHDDRFHAMINQIELNKRKTDRLVIDNVTPRAETETPSGSHNGASRAGERQGEQIALDYGFDGFRDAMYARIVQKVGERRYWETWARDVADIAQAHIIRIKGLLADSDSNPAKEFQEFLRGLRGNLNESITPEEAIEMLAQHLVTRPIFEALFEGYDFAAQNPVAKTMELMLASLDEHTLDAENHRLEHFYDSVRRRVEGVNNAEGKQRVIVELYDKFFATAFKKTVDKLGIVYTPIEIVDFILNSADQVLREEFGQGLTDEGVHILDGFTGTGTFMVRLLQSGLIEPHDLARKYANELHANEILLLAYYIAAVNIETTYADLTGASEAFPGLILTDTFQSYEDGDRDDLEIFPENNDRIARQRALPITVIVGNPPYSVGQDSANDDNQNTRYATIDEAIRTDYSSERGRGGNHSLYDSYIRAIKWASLRLGTRGVVAFLTNGGFLDSNVAGQMRRSLSSEYSSIYVFNLRGNGRVAGEEGKREGRPVFEYGGRRANGAEIKSSKGGSRATIAIVMLVKGGDVLTPGNVLYSQVDDYLSAGEKIRAVEGAGSFRGLDLVRIAPNAHGDWLNQRSDEYQRFAPVGDKKSATGAIFATHAYPVLTSRDSWVYASSGERLISNVTRTMDAFNKSVSSGTLNRDKTCISWSLTLEAASRRGETLVPDASRVRLATYRPFFHQRLYFDPTLIHSPGLMGRIFPTARQSNFGFYQVGAGSAVPFSVLMLDSVPDLHVTGAGSGGQFFPRWTYEEVEVSETLDLGGDAEVVDGYRKIDNITDETAKRFASAYPDCAISRDAIFYYVYGLLHSPEYRETYSADLKKMLPRIPLVRAFQAYSDAGRRLSELHLGYESVQPYPMAGLATDGPSGEPAYDFFAVGNKKMPFGKATAEQKAAGDRYDRSVIHYNDRITLRGVPLEAYGYMLGSRSAIEWIIDRYYVKTDKASGIVNDPNDWSREIGNPRYILDLLARIVTVSLDTMKIVDTLPPLDIIEGA